MLRRLVPALAVALAAALSGASAADAAVTFAPPQTTASGGDELWAMAVADVDGDGRPDVVAPTTFEWALRLGVMTTRANGTLRPAVQQPTTPTDAIATGDFDEDGSPDLVTGSTWGSGVYISLNDGNGGFGTATEYPFVDGAPAVGVGDFNGDDHLDVVSADNSTGGIRVLFGDGHGGFTAGPSHPLSDDISFGAIAVGDFDGDGGSDVAVADNWSDVVYLLHSSGDGTFTSAGTFSVNRGGCGCSGIWSIATPDLDGDGKDDVLATARWGNKLIPFLHPSGTFTRGTTVRAGGEPYAVATGDVNGDGKPDATTINYNDGTYSVQLGLGSGAFGPPNTHDTLPDGDGVPHAIQTADMDGDGKLDLVIGDQEGLISVVRNTSVPVAGVSAPSLAFGEQPLGTIGTPRTVLVRNTGDAPLHVIGATAGGANADDFLVGAGACATVVPGATCPIAVRFVPTAEATRSATLTIASDGSAAPLPVTLAGTGTAVAPGPKGDTGDTGPAGPQGEPGAGGAAGPSGADGANGANGANGADGANGIDGADGKDGSDGANGAPGTHGTDGTTGAPGANGATGGTGANGAKGAKGATGDKGARGADGHTPLVVVLAEPRMRRTTGRKVQVAFAATLPGRAVLTARRGGRTIAARQSKRRRSGSSTLTLPALARGTYVLRLAYTATDGRKRTASARLVVRTG